MVAKIPGAGIDANGEEIILDADADTTISADTDDQIDIKIAGADDFQLTANTFTVASGSKIAFADGGSISSLVGNMWRQTSSSTFSAGDSDLTSNWEAIDTFGGVAGSSMSESSGIFTFPATGIYQIKFQCMFSRNSDACDYAGARIYVTGDNFSSSSLVSTGYAWFENSAGIYGMTSAETIFDCTNTTTHKVKFNVNRESSIEMHGSSTSSITFAIFNRLGDT